MIEVNQIIKNLIPTEPVTVIKVQALGNMYSIKYTGVTTNKTSTKVIHYQRAVRVFGSIDIRRGI